MILRCARHSFNSSLSSTSFCSARYCFHLECKEKYDHKAGQFQVSESCDFQSGFQQ
ncbi:MAG: hypothetical protein OEZ22_06800 [Spirochaetia bacterium]|nr:hypothetical protein [Spirochaetia bacterium]